MKDVKSIGFGFENCEYFSIDAKYFGAFQLSDINTRIQRVACNSISRMDLVDSVVMEIFSEGNGEYLSGFGDEKVKFFDRIVAYNDITSITVIYDDDSEETYWVNYKEEVEDQLGSPNVYQQTEMNKFGDLYLVISPKPMPHFFDDKVINDEDSISFSKIMILD